MAERRLDIIIAAQNRAAGGFAGAAAAMRGFVGSLGGMGGMIAGALGGAAIGAFLHNAIAQFGEAEKAASDLAVGLAAQGEKAALSAAGIFTLAQRMQMLTTVEDDAVVSLAAYIARLGQLSGPALQQATQAALGLARATGIDNEQAARQYIRALDGTFTTLGRYIPELQKATNDTERMAIVNKKAAVGLQLMGAEAQTMGGRFAQAKVALGNLAEEIGGALLPVLQPLAEALTRNAEVLQGWARTAGHAIAGFGAWVTNFAAAWKVDWAEWTLAVAQSTDAVETAFANLYEFLGVTFANIYETGSTAFGNLFIVMQNVWTHSWDLVDAFGLALETMWSNAWQIVKNWGSNVYELLKATFEAIRTGSLEPFSKMLTVELLDGTRPMMEQFQKGWELVFAGVRSAALTAFEPIAGQESEWTKDAKAALERAKDEYDAALKKTLGEGGGDGGAEAAAGFEGVAGKDNDKAKRGRRGGGRGGSGAGSTVLSKSFLGLADTFASSQAGELKRIEANTKKAADEGEEVAMAVTQLNSTVQRALRGGVNGIPLNA